MQLTEENLLATHGKTFHFATRFFPRELRSSVEILYAFFRTLDNLVDEPVEEYGTEEERLALIVPVLNEVTRLAPCLEGLISQGEEVAEILVVDGGSSDGTQQMIRSYGQRDPRICLIDASPIPACWNGKAWGLEVGVQHASLAYRWLLMMDADVRPRPGLGRCMLAQAKKVKLSALSIATLQEIDGLGQALLHPSLLATLVYRFGPPGKIIHKISDVQANGQCFLIQREALEACGGFPITRDSVCEDITLARALVSAGYSIGFYEAGDLVTTQMYVNWRDTWHNWTRSLPMHDQFASTQTVFGWLEVTLVQALPLPCLLLLTMIQTRHRWLLTLNGMLTAIRISMELLGTATGFPFGPYAYTDFLGFKILGHVPYAIPLSWFYIGFTSLILANLLISRTQLHRQSLWTLLLGVYFLTVWDLSLDPSMVSNSLPIHFWTWYEKGPYFGMPIRNLVGWSLTGLTYMSVSRLFLYYSQVQISWHH